MTNPITHTSLSLHGGGECPVCSHPFTTGSDRVPGVDTQIAHADADCIEHLLTHDPRELAFAVLALDARLGMLRLATGSIVSTIARYDAHASALVADRRPALLP